MTMSEPFGVITVLASGFIETLPSEFRVATTRIPYFVRVYGLAERFSDQEAIVVND